MGREEGVCGRFANKVHGSVPRAPHAFSPIKLSTARRAGRVAVVPRAYKGQDAVKGAASKVRLCGVVWWACGRGKEKMRPLDAFSAIAPLARFLRRAGGVAGLSFYPLRVDHVGFELFIFLDKKGKAAIG